MTEQPQEPVLIDPLVLKIIEANSAALNYTTDQLLLGYENQLETVQATIDAIRDRIETLLSGPWLPSPRVIEAALYPSKQVVDSYRKKK